MLSLDDSERVVYASSFSKTVCPGIRVGYLVGPADLIAKIQKRATNTYISPNMVAQSIVYEFCASGRIRQSIDTVKSALAERVQLLSAALERELPDAKFTPPEGGYFMWVELPEGTDVDALFSAAAERGVAFVKGTDFLLDGGRNTLRLPTPASPPTRSTRASRASPRRTASSPSRPRSSARGQACPPRSPGSRSASRWRPGSGRSPSSR
jgi:DNA-binding transcriptional MocR family regulator